MATIAHEQGAQAFKNKQTKKSNHLGFETLGWHEWNDGFDAAKRESEAKPARAKDDVGEVARMLAEMTEDDANLDMMRDA